MPELHFKGKEFVFNHHLGVPYRPLEPDAAKSVGGTALDGNLIIQGDNLHALKALMPLYAGKVDCVFIDPPYNTGKDWSYNDNVNSPILREWLTTNPVAEDDMLRHDKWCCLMYPRLKLLYELLGETGSLWITLDDNEVHHARSVLDEIFGEDCCVGQFAWQKRTSRENRSVLSPSFDHILLYSKCLPDTWKLRRNLLPIDETNLANTDNDPRGPWVSVPFSAQGKRDNQVYSITTPTGLVLRPPKGRCWGATEPEFERLKDENLIYWPKNGNGRPRVKKFPTPEDGLVPDTLWLASAVGDTERSKKHLMSIFAEREELDIHAPKPVALVERIIQISTTPDSIVLDSFAGSGTTAHAVLAVNRKHGGNRRFVLVECENYADSLTAERMRRVINGYPFEGTTKEKLFSTKISFTSLKKADKLLKQIEGIENLEAHRFDNIVKTIKNDTLTVVGEKKITEKVDGLGGSFTYCTLGQPLDLDKLLTGESLPDYMAIGSWLFHTATMSVLDPAKVNQAEWYLGESSEYHVWLAYKPDLEFLKSRDAALTLNLAQKIAASKTGKKHLVFAAAKFVPNKDLLPMGVEFSPLPFALYRVEK